MSLDLTWSDNASNELCYRIESKIGATGTYELLTTFGPNTTAVTFTGSIQGTQYYYRLQGVNAGGRSAYSNETSVTTILDSPSGLTAQALSSSQVLLNWTDNSPTETAFRIERSPVTDRNFTEIATVGANITSFTDTGLSEATRNGIGACVTRTQHPTIGRKECYDLVQHSGSAVRAYNYVFANKLGDFFLDRQLWRRITLQNLPQNGAAGTYALIVTTAANVTSRGDYTVKDGTLYYYRVSATNAAGDSAFSNEASGMTLLKNQPLLLQRPFLKSN